MIKYFEAVQEAINGELAESFCQDAFGEYVTGSVTFSMGNQHYTMDFYNGTMLNVYEGLPLTGLDFGIAGPQEGWEQLFCHRNFSMAVAPKHGKLRHQGNLVRSMCNLNAMAFLCRALCDAVAAATE